jgi:hypothetical protein
LKGALFLPGDMKVQATGIKPNAAAMANGFRLEDFPQTEQPGIKRAGDIFAAFRHRDVDEGQTHMGNFEALGQFVKVGNRIPKPKNS